MKIFNRARGAAAGLLVVAVMAVGLQGCIGPEGRLDVPATVRNLEAGQTKLEEKLGVAAEEVRSVKDALVAARTQLEITRADSVEDREGWADELKRLRDLVAEAPEAEREALEETLAAKEEQMRAALAAGPGLQQQMVVGIASLEQELDKALDQEAGIRAGLAVTRKELDRLAAKGEDANLGDLIAAAGQAAVVIAPATGPAAPWVALVGAVATAVGGVIGALGVKRPGDVSPRRAREIEHEAWDESERDALAKVEAGEKRMALPPTAAPGYREPRTV